MPATRDLAFSLLARLQTIADEAIDEETVNSIVDDFGDNPFIDILRATPTVTDTFRFGDRIHVSDLLGKCMRQLALLRRLNMAPTPWQIHDSLGVTFAQGRASEDYVRNRIAKHSSANMFGDWSCQCGKRIVRQRGQEVATWTCRECNTKTDHYLGIHVEHPDLPLQGNVDVAVIQERIYFAEIKSIDGDAFDELNRPLPDHILQGAFYWDIMHRLGLNVFPQFSVLYVKKKFFFGLPYKEYKIEPQAVLHRLQPYYEDLEAYARAVDAAQPLPPRVVCATPDAPEARKCSVCVTCFAKA